MSKRIKLVPFDEDFIKGNFESHNDFMRKTGMNRSTFYARIYGGWWIRLIDNKGGRLMFDLLSYKESFDVQA